MALESGEGLIKGLSDTGGLATDTGILEVEKILDLVSNTSNLFNSSKSYWSVEDIHRSPC